MARPSGYAKVLDGFYVEESWATTALLDHLNLPTSVSIYDPACGTGNILRAALAAGHMPVIGTDLFKRNDLCIAAGDFLSPIFHAWKCDWVITNPPYKRGLTRPFLDKALTRHCTRGMAAFVPLSFLASEGRTPWFESTPVAELLIFGPRVHCPPGRLLMRGLIKAENGTEDYCWIVWRHGHTGPRTFSWLGRRA